jgi:hemerythrin-like domain-containing protein
VRKPRFKEIAMKATDILRSEHETILDVLAAVEWISHRAKFDHVLDLRSAQEALDFLRGFADRCHHGKEEQHFFPALAARGLPREVGPLAVMASEHDRGRALLAGMSEALADAQQSKAGAPARFGAVGEAYAEFMRNHIQKENGVLFPMGDGMLSEQEQTAVLSGFESFEHEDMGADAHQRFLDVAAGLCRRLGIHRDRSPGVPSHACCGHAAPHA